MTDATYDPQTPAGKVRFLSFDTSAPWFHSDEEIQLCLDLNAQDVRLAAAQALDQIAIGKAIIQGRTTIAGISLDGPALAALLAARAGELRRQVIEGDADPTGTADWAEMVVDPFTYRERIRNEWTRSA